MHAPVVALALKLIDIESVSGNEKTMADFLQEYLEPLGWRVVRQAVAAGRDNIYAHRRQGRPRLVFNSHIDTVPPFFPASIDHTWIRGRGACDTKSLIAAQLLAAQALVEKGHCDIGLLYVVGEEVDHSGMLRANELGIQPEFLIVAEPTESKLARRQKGILKFHLECHGTAAHSGYPHTGSSAIETLLDVLQDLRQAHWPEDATLGATTLNIGILKGGRAANVLADHASAEALMRVVTNEREIRDRVAAIVGARAQVRIIAGNDPHELHTMEGYETVVVAFNTDIPYFKGKCKALLWGAGSILDAHTAAEKIKIADLEAAVAIYQDLAERCLASMPVTT